MGPEVVGNFFVVVGIPILFARLVVGTSYERRTSKLWTFALPTGALLVFITRAAITRNFDLFMPTDWVATFSWGLLVGSQLVATIYGWWPTHITDQREEETHAAHH